MPVLVLAVLVVVGLLLMNRRRAEGDLPARLVSVATNRFAASCGEWGQAMAAELTAVPARSQRWRFALGVARVALFPPIRHRGRLLWVAAAGLAAAAGATALAARDVPSLSVFVAVLGVLLCGYATVATTRMARPSVPQGMVAVLGLAGVGALIGVVVWTAHAHPAATADATHVFSVVLALTLCGYLVVALTPPHLGQATRTVLWWALGSALASGAGWLITSRMAAPATLGVIALISPVGVAAVLLAAIGAATATASAAAGARAGVLAAVLGAPIRVTLDLVGLLRVPQYTLTDPFDVAAFPHSGYPDAASYLLSDALGGEILGGLIISPIVLLVVALAGGAIGPHLRGRPA